MQYDRLLVRGISVHYQPDRIDDRGSQAFELRLKFYPLAGSTYDVEHDSPVKLTTERSNGRVLGRKKVFTYYLQTLGRLASVDSFSRVSKFILEIRTSEANCKRGHDRLKLNLKEVLLACYYWCWG